MKIFVKRLCIVTVALIVLCSAVGCKNTGSDDLLLYSAVEGGYEVSLNPARAEDAVNVEIPATYNGAPVIRVADYGFANSNNLKSVTMPEGLLEIGVAAFSNCTSLGGVNVPETVKKIDQYAFSNCTALEIALIGDGVETIGKYAFAFCTALKNIKLSESLRMIDTYTFYDCGALLEISLPDTVETVEVGAFYNCASLASVSIGKGLSMLNIRAFDACDSVTTVTVNAENASYLAQNNILYTKVSLDIVYVPAKLQGDIVIVDGTKMLAANLFAYNKGITSLTIPASVEKVGACLVLDCDALETVTFVDATATWINANDDHVSFSDPTRTAINMRGADENTNWAMASWKKKTA